MSPKILSPEMKKRQTKKNRAFQIHSNMSRHEMHKQLKERPFNVPKNTESQNGKMLDQKKNWAFHIHSKMSRHEMPKQLKKRFIHIPKNTKTQNAQTAEKTFSNRLQNTKMSAQKK